MSPTKDALPAQNKWTNKTLFHLVWPLMIEQLLAATVGMADTAMVAAVSEGAVGGVALVDSINILLIMAFSALATGGAVVSSQYLGRRDDKNASLAARQLVYSIFFVSFILMLVVLIFRRQILGLVFGHISPDVMQNANTYFWLSGLSYPFIALYNAGAALFRSMGNSRVGMFTSLIINVINIGGNFIFIFIFNMGVAGAALSTLISRAVAGIIIINLLANQGGTRITLKGLSKPRLNFVMIKSILKIGIPNGLESSMFQIGKLLVSRLVSTFGTAVIAGNAIAGIIATFGNLPGQAVGLALLTVVGQGVGSKNFAAAKQNTKTLMKFAFVAMAAIDIIIFIFLRPIIGSFNLSAQAANVAYWCMLIYCPCNVLFWPQSFSLPNALRAAGDARYTMLVSLFSMWAFRIGLSFLLATTFKLGIYGIWVAMVIDWVVRGIFFTIRWKNNKWQKNKLI